MSGSPRGSLCNWSVTSAHSLRPVILLRRSRLHGPKTTPPRLSFLSFYTETADLSARESDVTPGRKPDVVVPRPNGGRAWCWKMSWTPGPRGRAVAVARRCAFSEVHGGFSGSRVGEENLRRRGRTGGCDGRRLIHTLYYDYCRRCFSSVYNSYNYLYNTVLIN